MSDQFVAEAATYTTHKIHNGRTSMSSAGFELAIQAIKPLQVQALDRKAIGIGVHAFRDQKTIPITHKDVGRKE